MGLEEEKDVFDKRTFYARERFISGRRSLKVGSQYLLPFKFHNDDKLNKILSWKSNNKIEGFKTL